jgi:hypothetical protein
VPAYARAWGSWKMKTLGFSKGHEFIAQLFRVVTQKNGNFNPRHRSPINVNMYQKNILPTLFCFGFQYFLKYVYYVAFEVII